MEETHRARSRGGAGLTTLRVPRSHQGCQHMGGVLSKNSISRGAWVTRLVEHLTLDFSPGHYPRVVGLSLTLGSTLSVESA